jgi:hypothetical protein
MDMELWCVAGEKSKHSIALVCLQLHRKTLFISSIEPSAIPHQHTDDTWCEIWSFFSSCIMVTRQTWTLAVFQDHEEVTGRAFLDWNLLCAYASAAVSQQSTPVSLTSECISTYSSHFISVSLSKHVFFIFTTTTTLGIHFVFVT